MPPEQLGPHTATRLRQRSAQPEGQTLPQNREAVGPGCRMRRKALAMRRTQAEAAVHQGQLRSPQLQHTQLGALRHRAAVSSDSSEQVPQAGCQRIVIASGIRSCLSRRQRSQQVVAPWPRAEEEQQPRRLQIGHAREAVEQPLMLGALLLQIVLDEVGMANGGGQNNQAAPLGRERPGANPDVSPARPLERTGAGRIFSSRVPDPRLPKVHLYARMLLQHNTGNAGHRAHTLRWAHGVHVVVQRRVLPRRVQGWHERVSLLAPFCLDNAVRHARVVVPEVRAAFRVEQTSEGEQRGERVVTREAPQHAGSMDMVIGPDAIYAHDRRARLPLTQGANGPGSSLRSGPSPERKLEGPASAPTSGLPAGGRCPP